MQMRIAGIFILCGTLAWSLAVTATGPSSPPKGEGRSAAPGEMDLKWNRDFDLLLDMGNVPTVQEKQDALKRESLEKERADLGARLSDLEKRLSAIEGSYTTEAILQEMVRQGVSDMQTAKANLRRKIDQTQQKLENVDKALERLEPNRQE